MSFMIPDPLVQALPLLVKQRDKCSCKPRDLSIKAQQEAYIRLCAEAQKYYLDGYVPESFVQKVVLLSQAEAGLIPIDVVTDCLNLKTETPAHRSMAIEKQRIKESRQATMPAHFQRREVPGDGNCGLHALAYGMIHKRVGIDRLKQKMVYLPDNNDNRTVLNGLDRLHNASDSQRLLNDRHFMFALARILRQAGYNEIVSGNWCVRDQKTIENLIPEADGEWVSDEGLLILADRLDVKVYLDQSMHGQIVPTGTLINPDFAIQLSGNHFTPYVC